ncbi:MAG: dihydropteroate synthase [Actinomycetes bacterium]
MPVGRYSVPARDRLLELGVRPWLMGVVNATPDSFSDAGERRTLEDRVELAKELLEGGADVIDIGGESGVTNAPPVDPAEEIERVVPLIERVAGDLGAVVSVDTYKPAVARAALDAGAVVVNDVSGLRDPELADVCAESGAALVIMHTRARPKEKLLDRSMDGKMLDDVVGFLEERIEFATSRGVAFESIITDPGPDFGKTPSQTVEVLRGIERVHALGRPVLLAIGRKDFIGAATGRPPRQREAGTLAALGWGAEHGGHIFRVHDVAACRDYLTVRDLLDGRIELPPDTVLAENLRREPGS